MVRAGGVAGSWGDTAWRGTPWECGTPGAARGAERRARAGSPPCPQQHVGLCSGGVGSSSRVQDVPWGCRVLARPGQDLKWGYVCPENRGSLLGVLPPSGWSDPFRAPCWGALRVLGSHAGTKHVPTPPRGEEPVWGHPPRHLLPALFAGTRVGVSHGGVRRFRGGQLPCSRPGEAATGKVLPVTGVCSCPGWSWLPPGSQNRGSGLRRDRDRAGLCKGWWRRERLHIPGGPRLPPKWEVMSRGKGLKCP